MVAYNDSYGQYLDHQIREEENLKRLTGKSDILERLKANKQEYEQEVNKYSKVRLFTVRIR